MAVYCDRSDTGEVINSQGASSPEVPADQHFVGAVYCAGGLATIMQMQVDGPFVVFQLNLHSGGAMLVNSPPPTQTPEVPVTPMLFVVGIGAVTGYGFLRRRRTG